MTKCEIFLDYFNNLLSESGKSLEDMPEAAQEFYAALESSKDSGAEAVTFTPIGLKILEFMQQSTAKSFKAKDIAEGMAEASRKVSGAMRKLLNDGYVEKYGENPVNYMITTKGKEIDLTQYKES